MDDEAIPAQAVIGENVRRIRTSVGATADDLARTAREQYGLKWSVSRVQELERGKLPVSAGLLFTLADLLAEFVGAPVALDELFSGEGYALLTPKLVVDRAAVRRALAEGVDFHGSDFPPLKLDPIDLSQIPSLIARAGKLYPSGTVPAAQERRALQNQVGLAEEHAARRLNLTPDAVAAWAQHLWNRSLTAERDARSLPGASPQSKGRITRDLLTEIRAARDGRSVG